MDGIDTTLWLPVMEVLVGLAYRGFTVASSMCFSAEVGGKESELSETQRAAKQILLLDECDEIIELFREITEGMGHRLTALSRVPDNVASVMAARPNLVVSEVVFSGEQSGWDLVHDLSASRATERIPIIVCTAATDGVREQAGRLAANAVSVVLKPFAVEELERAISRALEPRDAV